MFALCFTLRAPRKLIYWNVDIFRISQDIFWQNYKNGLTLEDTVEQLHCESCNKYVRGLIVLSHILDGVYNHFFINNDVDFLLIDLSKEHVHFVVFT